MVHSSSSKGVIVSDISADYYVRTYAGAGSVDKYRAMVSGKYTEPTPTVKPETRPIAATSGKKIRSHKNPRTAFLCQRQPLS